MISSRSVSALGALALMTMGCGSAPKPAVATTASSPKATVVCPFDLLFGDRPEFSQNWLRCPLDPPMSSWGGLCPSGRGCMRPCRAEVVGGSSFRHTVSRYSYDASGRLVRASTSNFGEEEGATEIAYEYDQGRPIRARYGQRLIAFRYSGGRLAGTDDGTEFEYDADGNLTRVSYMHEGQPRIAHTYEYDALGRLTVEHDSFLGRTDYDYNAAGRLASVRGVHRGATAHTFEYDASGRVSAIVTPGSERRETFRYDERSRLVEQTGDGWTTRYYYDCGL